MIQFNLNNFFLIVEKKSSIITNFKYLGQFLPRFCFHDNLPVAGNCRACLVELSGSEKPIAACVTEVEQNFTLWTNNPFTMKARENVFSFLLANHPLDCPICDQAGECDLQDQTKKFANNSSYFFFKKRGVVDKAGTFGVKTIMTRCIHCTRCVRFTTLHQESFLGIFNRGYASEIGQYSKKTQKSYLTMNVTDFCPVNFCTVQKLRQVQKNLNLLIFCTGLILITIIILTGYCHFFCSTPFLSIDVNLEWKKLLADVAFETEQARLQTLGSLTSKIIEVRGLSAEVDLFIQFASTWPWARPTIISADVPELLRDALLDYYKNLWLTFVSEDISRAAILQWSEPVSWKDGGILLNPVTAVGLNKDPLFLIFLVPASLLISGLLISFLITPNKNFFFNFKDDFNFFLKNRKFVLLFFCFGYIFFFSNVYFLDNLGMVTFAKPSTVITLAFFIQKKGIVKALIGHVYAIYYDVLRIAHNFVWR